jgi:hypothetical protein
VCVLFCWFGEEHIPVSSSTLPEVQQFEDNVVWPSVNYKIVSEVVSALCLSHKWTDFLIDKVLCVCVCVCVYLKCLLSFLKTDKNHNNICFCLTRSHKWT